MSGPYLGEIRLFSYASIVPQGWMACDGALLPVNQNQALFSLINYFYGGSGPNFALPDLRGRAIAGTSQTDPRYKLANADGVETVTLTTANLQTHDHNWLALYGTANTPRPAGNYYSASSVNSGALFGPSSPDANVTLNAGVLSTAGQNQPHNNMQAFLVGLYCICTDGHYPGRN